MEKKFLFITHLSPKSIRSSLRQGLIESMEKSLYAQTYTNWKALWIGEREFQDNKIKEVSIGNKKDLAVLYLRQDILDYINDCDYIIKLDDDDIIFPNVLTKASEFDFDCYCDEYHTFYDISSGVLTQQKRAWIASTCIHKKEHALKNQTDDQPATNFINSFFYGDHGKDWIAFYKNKKIIYADRKLPVYIRVLSPTSITAGAKTFPVKSFDDIDMNHYYRYLKQFGAWNNYNLEQFENFKEDLRSNWKKFSNKEQTNIKGISFLDKTKDKIKNYLK